LRMEDGEAYFCETCLNEILEEIYEDERVRLRNSGKLQQEGSHPG